jgi:ADP-ribose pyrophosphatase YjhB (NUDIX family)
MELQVGVKTFLKNTEGKYLLMRRSDLENVGKRKWDIPGGRLEVGSSMLDNLAREVMEETGLVMTSVPTLFDAQDLIWHDGRHVVRILYKGTIEGAPTLSHEHSEYKWMTVDEMLALNDVEFDRFLVALVHDKADELR